jgi:hypothetical protein
MPATTEQWQIITDLKAQHAQELAEFDEECRTKRIEMAQDHDREFDELYRRFGGRRDRSINEGKRLQKGGVISTNYNPNKGEQDGTGA